MAGEVKTSEQPKRRATKRSYEAAQRSRNGDNGGWLAIPRSADSQIYNEARTLREKSRWLVRNNVHAAKAVSSLVSNIIGDGIVPRPVTGDPKQDRKVWDKFNRWTLKCDHGGMLDFYGMQTLACREFIEGGEVLFRKRIRKQKFPGDIPLELQLLEADFLDPMRNGIMRDGTLTVQGVEIDIDTQKRTAYWLYPFHPGNMPYFVPGVPMMSSPVDASEVLHVYEQQRVQTRGVPWCTPAIEELELYSDYKLAEVVRKKIEACAVGVVAGAESDDEDSIGRVTDADGNEVESFEPGMIIRAHGAKTVTFNAPTAVGGYGEYSAKSLQAIAAGWRVPYELLSGDLSEVNFSSMRGGLIEFRRLVATVQWQILIQLALQPIWEWWCEIAFLAGEIDAPYIPVEWSTPKFAWVDPLADVQTAALEVRNGFRSWQDVIGETGRNPDDVLDEIKEWNEKVDDLEIILDSDPRKTNAKGVQQPEPESDGGNEPELSRPNRNLDGRKNGKPSKVRARGASSRRELQRGSEHGRHNLDDRRGGSALRLLGRH